MGKLNRNMYGFRDAANGWFRDWQSLLASKGYKTGVANPALFHNPQRGARGGVHGDDFYVLAKSKDLDEANELLASSYSVRETHRLGFGHGCVQEATVLNRVVKLGIENGRKCVQIEPDSRHVQLIIKTLGFSSKSGSTAVPGVKVSDAELERRLSEPQLSKIETSAFRSCVMRAAFLAQDRADIGEAVKGLTSSVAIPTAGSWRDLKHLGRNLIGKPNVVL